MAKRLSKTQSQMLGGIGYAVVGEPLLDMVASKLGVQNADEFIKGILGYFVAENTKGVVKAVGHSAVNIASYKLGGQKLGNLLQGFGGARTTATAQSTNGAPTF